jgi:amino acid permease
MTIGAIVLLVMLAIFGVFAVVSAFVMADSKCGIIVLLVAILVLLSCFFGFKWYYSSTASGMRAVKDQQSNLNNGLNREITITAEDGREIYHYKGKCDIETQDRYILFEGEDGLRRTIYWGITDTIIIEELD